MSSEDLEKYLLDKGYKLGPSDEENPDEPSKRYIYDSKSFIDVYDDCIWIYFSNDEEISLDLDDLDKKHLDKYILRQTDILKYSINTYREKIKCLKLFRNYVDFLKKYDFEIDKSYDIIDDIICFRHKYSYSTLEIYCIDNELYLSGIGDDVEVQDEECFKKWFKDEFLKDHYTGDNIKKEFLYLFDSDYNTKSYFEIERALRILFDRRRFEFGNSLDVVDFSLIPKKDEIHRLCFKEILKRLENYNINKKEVF